MSTTPMVHAKVMELAELPMEFRAMGMCALALHLEHSRNELAEALREYLEARRVEYPRYELGSDAQRTWGLRIEAAERNAIALLARLDAEKEIKNERA